MRKVLLVILVLTCVLLGTWWAYKRYTTVPDFSRMVEASSTGSIVEGIPADWIQATSTVTGIRSDKVRTMSTTIGNALTYDLSYYVKGVDLSDLVKTWKLYLSKNGYRVMQVVQKGQDTKFYAVKDTSTLFIEIVGIGDRSESVTISLRTPQ